MSTDLVTELRRGKLRPGLRAEAADEIEALNARLEQINMLACYASEEDTAAQPAALLEIGKLARKEKTP